MYGERNALKDLWNSLEFSHPKPVIQTGADIENPESKGSRNCSDSIVCDLEEASCHTRGHIRWVESLMMAGPCSRLTTSKHFSSSQQCHYSMSEKTEGSVLLHNTITLKLKSDINMKKISYKYAIRMMRYIPMCKWDRTWQLKEIFQDMLGKKVQTA